MFCGGKSTSVERVDWVFAWEGKVSQEGIDSVGCTNVGGRGLVRDREWEGSGYCFRWNSEEERTPG